MIGGLRVEIVADEDANAHPQIPKDVLATLEQGMALTSGAMMYIRETTWEKIKRKFPNAFNGLNNARNT